MRIKIAVRTVIGLTIAGTVAVTWSPVVDAGAASADLTLSASVANNCTIATSTLAFGAYDAVVANASVDLDGAGQVTIACTKGAAPTIELGLGMNASGSVRRLKSGASYLTYEVYSDSGRATVWGTGSANDFEPGAAPSKAARNIPVYGRIVANQDVIAGTYSDTVEATVNF
jgi:spore coat protein U-like protein